MSIRTVLFDLDGTLIDSAPDLCASINAVRHNHGLPALPYNALRPWAGAGARGLIWAGLRVQPEAPAYASLQTEFLDAYAEIIGKHLELFDGVEAMLATLNERRIPWGIVTNKALKFAQILVDRVPALRATQCLISGFDIGASKPKPDGIWLGLKALGMPADGCVYVGDDARDSQAAIAAGVKFAAASWGYTNSNHAHPIENWGSDWILTTPAELLDVVTLSNFVD